MGVTAPILLYGSTDPRDAAGVAAVGAIVTIDDFASLEAFAGVHRGCTAYVKFDCGFGRFGFTEGEWRLAFGRLAGANGIRVSGLDRHLGHTENRALIEPQVTLFRRAASERGRPRPVGFAAALPVAPKPLRPFHHAGGADRKARSPLPTAFTRQDSRHNALAKIT